MDRTVVRSHIFVRDEPLWITVATPNYRRCPPFARLVAQCTSSKPVNEVRNSIPHSIPGVGHIMVVSRNILSVYFSPACQHFVRFLGGSTLVIFAG